MNLVQKLAKHAAYLGIGLLASLSPLKTQDSNPEKIPIRAIVVPENSEISKKDIIVPRYLKVPEREINWLKRIVYLQIQKGDEVSIQEYTISNSSLDLLWIATGITLDYIDVKKINYGNGRVNYVARFNPEKGDPYEDPVFSNREDPRRANSQNETERNDSDISKRVTLARTILESDINGDRYIDWDEARYVHSKMLIRRGEENYYLSARYSGR